MDRPKLILLIGPPGCGKSTYAETYMNEHHEFVTHVSSDEIRKQLWGDEAIQGDNSQVFSRMQDETIQWLNGGWNVLYDATNMTRKDRASIIAACPKFAKIEAHVIFTPIEVCIEQDANRERTVGKAVIDRMLKRFQAPYYDEGIDEIKVILPDGLTQYGYYSKVMDAMRIPHDNPHHTVDIYEHCSMAYKYATNRPCLCSTDVQIAALYHDIGKPYVKAFVDNKGNPCEHAHYYQHHCVGAYMSYGLNVNPEVAWLISTHMDPFFNTKYYQKLPTYLKNKIDALHEADLAAH